MIRNLLVGFLLLALGVIAFGYFQRVSKLDLADHLPAQQSNESFSSIGTEISQNSYISTALPELELTDSSFTNDDPRQILLYAAKYLEQSRPLSATVRYKVNLFDQEISGLGLYVQAGQGTGRWRLELDGKESGINYKLAQISDGRYFYRVESVGNQRDVAFVDMESLRPSQADSVQINLENPWSSIEGIPTLLRQLANHFQFDQTEKTKLGKLDVYRLTGKWQTSAVQKLFGGTENQSIQLAELPVQIPHAVQLVVGDSNDKFPLFPYRIVFYRLDETGQNTDSSRKKLKPTVMLEFYNLKRLDTAGLHLFQIETNEKRSRDLTEEYQQRAEQIQTWR